MRTGLTGLNDRFRLPDVLTKCHTDMPTRLFKYAGPGSGTEVTTFVEYTVVGQALFAVSGKLAAIAQNGRGVVDVTVVEFGVADHRRDAVDRVAQFGQRCASGFRQSVAQQQVIRRIAEHGHFRKGHDIGLIFVPGSFRSCNNLRRVALNVTDAQIQLGHHDPQCVVLCHRTCLAFNPPLKIASSRRSGPVNAQLPRQPLPAP